MNNYPDGVTTADIDKHFGSEIDRVTTYAITLEKGNEVFIINHKAQTPLDLSRKLKIYEDDGYRIKLVKRVKPND